MTTGEMGPGGSKEGEQQTGAKMWPGCQLSRGLFDDRLAEQILAADETVVSRVQGAFDSRAHGLGPGGGSKREDGGTNGGRGDKREAGWEWKLEKGMGSVEGREKPVRRSRGIRSRR